MASQDVLLLFRRSIHPLALLLMLGGMLVLTGDIYAQLKLKRAAQGQFNA